MANTDTTYAQALAELEKILTQLRAENCDVDTLAERTPHSSFLIPHSSLKCLFALSAR